MVSNLLFLFSYVLSVAEKKFRGRVVGTWAPRRAALLSLVDLCYPPLTSSHLLSPLINTAPCLQIQHFWCNM